jgi:Uma2 family endonuclease
MSTTVHVTYEQFEEMIRRGELGDPDSDDRYELLFGEVILLPHPNPPHVMLVAILTEWSFQSLPAGTAWIWTQNPLGIPELDSLALPDVAWMRRIDYSQRYPLPEDVFLVIEVSDTTLSRDRNLKASLYAQAGIADYWIVNVSVRTLEIRRDPQGDSYRSIAVLRSGDEARPLAFPDIVLPVSRLFPD